MNVNNKISVIIVLAILAIGITSSVNRVSAYNTEEENTHYNDGYDAARSDCYDTHICWGYYHSPDFMAHSPDFRDGYTAIVDWYYHKGFAYCDHARYDCSGTNDYDHDAANQAVTYNKADDSSTNNQAYSDNGNKNIDTTNTATDTTQKTTTTQNVVNTPTIICKGICSIPNIQTVTSDTGTNSGNNIPHEPPASNEDDGSPY